MLKLVYIVLSAFLMSLSVAAYGQDVLYMHKLGKIISDNHTAASVLKSADSIKQTRRAHDSDVEVFFTRNIDFGYKQQRIDIEYNSTYYVINLMLKNDSVKYASVTFDATFGIDIYKNLKDEYIDTAACITYINLRNNYYHSSKTLTDLSKEISFEDEYAFYCGDGMPKTNQGKYIEKLAKHVRIKSLEKLLQSITCEEQAYGVAGFDMLVKNNIKLPERDIKLVNYLKERKSQLVVCEGCFGHLLK